jgi:hypothetical protein
MGTLRLFWFFVWRMALWGVSLCIAAMVVFCVALQIGGILMGRGWLGPFYAVFYVVGLGAAGAVMGLLLGLLCGAVLFGVTRAFFWSRPGEHGKYVRTMAWACALGSILALTADWMVHGLLDLRTYDAESRSFFDPFTFVLWRIIQGHEHSTVSFDPTWAINLTVMVVVPTLLFALVMWWAGRRTAGRYARGFEAARGGAFATATWPVGGRIAGRRYGRGSLDQGDRE